MKFTRKKSPFIGNIRVRKIFAFFPISGEETTYWLEKVVVEEKYCWEFHNLIALLRIDGKYRRWVKIKVNGEDVKQ